jgi:hypothetical protein
MANSANAAAAGDRPFTLAMDFTGPGGGTYAIHVDKGAARMSQGAPARMWT